MNNRNCGNCKYYAEYEGVCCCSDSDEVADFTDREFCCKAWCGGSLNNED